MTAAMPFLHFKGKALVENHHLSVPFHELLPVRSKGLSKKASLHDNLIIGGDNLAALKALMPIYHGKVKCIYIDPPYNTGNGGWIYNDNVNSPMMRDWLGKIVDSDDLTRHDKWCCMMWPRLQLLRELLAEDGVIFVSIDDNEAHRLRMIMDEIFGEDNFVGSFIWEGTGKNDATFISVGHDYVFCYARSIEALRANRNRWRVFKEGADQIQRKAAEFLKKRNGDFEMASDDLKDWFQSLDKKNKAWAHRHYNYIDANGVYFAGDISWPGGGGPNYEIIHPRTAKPVKIPARGWGFSKREKMQQAIADGRVHFGKDETFVPNLKRYLHETDDQVLTSVFYKDRRAAHQRLKQILPDTTFRYPKDERTLQLLFEAVTSDNDIVLDSFAGSGATAHAVLAQNREDGGNRRFILVECEDYVDSLTAERVRRVAKGIPSAKDKALKTGLGGAFSYFKLGRPLRQRSILDGSRMPSYEELAAYVFFTATGEEFEPEKIRKDKWFIGKSRLYDVFLIYEDDPNALKELALSLEAAQKLPRGERNKLVFAPIKHLDQEFLHKRRIIFLQLPFQIYEPLRA